MHVIDSLNMIFFLAEQRKKERKKKNFGSEEMVRTEKMHATKNNNNK